MGNFPLVSVIMPVYNGEKYLNEAIESILEQTYKDFEFIIINDGSVDNTEKIILSYSDLRIKYIRNGDNLQIVKTLNKGILLAKGKYIIRMDADDISLPNRFVKQLEFMEKHPDISVCGTWVQTFGVRKKIWKYPLNHEEIKINLIVSGPSLAHPSVIIRKNFFDNFKYEEKYNKAEDYALWAESVYSCKFANIPVPLLKYRLHSEQTNKIIQTNMTNEIRAKLFKIFFNKIDDLEIKKYIEINENKKFSLLEVEQNFSRLLGLSIKSDKLNQKLLEKAIAIKFLTYIRKNIKSCIQAFYFYHKSSLQNFLPFYSKIYLISIIKCLISWRI